MIRTLFLLLFFSLLISNTYAQDTGRKTISVKGTAIDSTDKEFIDAATVAIYNKRDLKLLKYGFTNTRGQFALSDIAIQDSALLLKITHIGYTPRELDFIIPSALNEIDLDSITLTVNSTLMEEVVINKPPIMMNVDTLEINPSAFNVNENTVVEDLLKQVPGIVVWGDGKITVNGKSVSNILVEGKPFFGTDPVIATRNLPNEAIDKIKVYDAPSNEPETEQTVEMDIILKNKKKNGLFGKASLGAGSQGRKEALLALNLFDKKNQLTLFAAANNSNKEAYTTSDFLRFTVYQPGGEDLNTYTSSFSQPGLNEFAILGTKFERQWTPKFNTDIDILYYDKNVRTTRGIDEVRYLNGGQFQKISEETEDSRDKSNLVYNGKGRFVDKKREFNIFTKFEHNSEVLEQNSQRRARESSGQDLSLWDRSTSDNKRSRASFIHSDYTIKDAYGGEKLKISYRLEIEDIKNSLKQDNHFTDFLNNEADSTNRLKRNDVNNTKHELSTQIDMVSLFGQISNWKFDFNNYLNLTNQQASQTDWRMNPITSEYSDLNAALTYEDRLQETLWRPGLTVGRSKLNRLARGIKMFGFSADMDLEGFFRRNMSTHALRGLYGKQYNILPAFRLFYNQDYSTVTKRMEFNYQSKVKRPELYQQISLSDTLERNYNYVGNRSLEPENQYQFSVKYLLRQSLNSTYHDVTLNYTLFDNQMVDSNRYDNSGGLTQYTVNTNGLPSLGLTYTYQTARKLIDRPINLLVSITANSRNNYFFNNGTKYRNNRLGATLFSRVNYDINDIFALKLNAFARINKNDYSTNTIRIFYNSIGTDLILKWPKRMTFINSFSYSYHKVGELAESNQYLWNAHIYYRMLKKEQLELKFSVYDILNNKKNIIDTANQNMIKRVLSNNLRQYFMFSISFYPRKF